METCVVCGLPIAPDTSPVETSSGQPFVFAGVARDVQELPAMVESAQVHLWCRDKAVTSPDASSPGAAPPADGTPEAAPAES